jgi:hypothetical protein
MHRNTLVLLSLGVVSGLLLSRAASAAIWSMEADCARGDWSVEVTLDGFAMVDASCAERSKTRLWVDVADQIVTGGSIAAISSRGTVCEGPETSDSKFTLKCGIEMEDASGSEIEEELEVEVEREGPDETDPVVIEDK